MTEDSEDEILIALERRTIRALDEAVMFATAARAIYAGKDNKGECLRLDHVLYHFAKASRAMTEELEE